MPIIYYSYIIVISIIYLFYGVKSIRYYWSHFWNYIFCIEDVHWNKKVERPRILLLSVSIVNVCISYFFLQFKIFIENFIFYSLLSTVFFAIAFLLLYLSWSSKFEKTYLPKVKKLLTNKIEVKSRLSDVKVNDKLFDKLKLYINGSDKTIETFLKYDGTDVVIPQNEKLVWIDNRKLTNNREKGNKQTFIFFIMTLFEIEKPIVIMKIADLFFKFETSLSRKNISDLNSNKNQYIKDFREEIDKIIEEYNSAHNQSITT